MDECKVCANADNEYCFACDNGNQFKPITITHADRIRAMTDEELAEWITELTDCEVYPHTRKDVPCVSIGQTCAASWLDWLKQEAANDNHDN